MLDAARGTRYMSSQQSALDLTFLSLMADGSPATGGSSHTHYTRQLPPLCRCAAAAAPAAAAAAATVDQQSNPLKLNLGLPLPDANTTLRPMTARQSRI